MKSGDKVITSLLRVLVSDIQRDPNKDYCDNKVISVVKKTIASLSDPYVMEKAKDDTIRSIEFLNQSYLPKRITDDEIISFIDTIDFSLLKNKIQAVGMIQKHFPDGSVDGLSVKNLVISYKEV